MRTTSRSISILGWAAAGLAVGAGTAHAQLTTADVGVNPTFEQDSSGVTSTGGFFSARAFVNSSSDYSGGTLVYNSGGIQNRTLSYVPADGAFEFSDSNGSFSALQALYPAVTYLFNLAAGTQPDQAVSIAYAGDAYSNTPELTAASFTALQGMNAAAPLTLDFDTMDVSPNATPGANAIFFSIVNSADVTVFSDTLSTTATSVTIPGGALSPGQSYSFDLLFDDRIVSTTNGGTVLVTQFYDTHTDGSFSTAAGVVPEPSTWAMMLIGFGGLGLAVARRGRKQRVTATAR